MNKKYFFLLVYANKIFSSEVEGGGEDGEGEGEEAKGEEGEEAEGEGKQYEKTFEKKGAVTVEFCNYDVDNKTYYSPENFKFTIPYKGTGGVFNNFSSSLEGESNINLHDHYEFGDYYYSAKYYDEDGKLIENFKPNTEEDCQKVSSVKIKEFKSVQIFAGSLIKFNDEPIEIGGEVIASNYFILDDGDNNENKNWFLSIVKDLKVDNLNEICNNEDNYYVKSYIVDDTLYENNGRTEDFADFIKEYIKNIDKKKTELEIDECYTYDTSPVHFLLADVLGKKYRINKDLINNNFNYANKNLDNLDDGICKLMNDENDKYYNVTYHIDELINGIKGKFGLNGDNVTIGYDSDNHKDYCQVTFTKVDSSRDFIIPYKTKLSFTPPLGFMFEQPFKYSLELDYVKDDITKETKIIEYLNKKFGDKFSNENVTIKEYVDNNKLEDLGINADQVMFNGEHSYQVILNVEIPGITKKIDKSKLLINIEFDLADNIKDNYEFSKNFDNVESQYNNFTPDKKISDLKSYIVKQAGNIDNYILKENKNVINDDNKQLVNATYKFIFKEGSSCIKEKQKPKKDDNSENGNEKGDNSGNSGTGGQSKRGCCCGGKQKVNSNIGEKGKEKGCCYGKNR